MPQYNDAEFDALAPRIRNLTACNAPELPETPSVLHQAIAIGTRAVKYKAGFLRLAVAIIRRAEQAAYEYRRGRHELIRFLELLAQRDERLDVYAQALAHFEQCLFQIGMAITIHNAMTGQQLYNGQDGSEAARFANFYNKIKHFSGPISKPTGQLKTRLDITAPVWITNEGLASYDNDGISWDDLKGTVEELLRSAEVLSTPPSQPVTSKGADASKG